MIYVVHKTYPDSPISYFLGLSTNAVPIHRRVCENNLAPSYPAYLRKKRVYHLRQQYKDLCMSGCVPVDLMHR